MAGAYMIEAASVGRTRSRGGTSHRKYVAVLLALAMLGIQERAPAVPGEKSLVSVSTDGTQADRGGEYPSVTADGRFIAFESRSSNLAPGDSNAVSDVFVHDQITGQTERVSLGAGGVEGNGESTDPSISADGRYVAFSSRSSNLLPDGTYLDVYVRDRLVGETTRVSLGSGGTGPNEGSYQPSISSDGRYIAFTSFASNLVPGDTNGTPDVFVRDRTTGDTSRVSVTTGGQQGNGWSYAPAISGDGRLVAFASDATAIFGGGTGTRIFVRDRMLGQLIHASSGCGDNAFDPAISADGRYVAFTSLSISCTSGSDANGDVADIFVRDLQAGSTGFVSVNSSGFQATGPSHYPSVSADGRYVTFQSAASDLVPGDANGGDDVFVRDLVGAETTVLSTGLTGDPWSGNTGNGGSERPAISSDARFVAFSSSASNLVAGDSNGYSDVFVGEPGKPFLQFFALGDSVASGEGLADAVGDCARSPSAYPALLADELASDFTTQFHHFACARATARTSETNPDDLIDQVAAVVAAREQSARALVTITVGWSDLDIEDPVRQRSVLCDDPPDAFRAYSEAAAIRIGDGVAQAVGALLAQPGVSVVVTELYQPINGHPTYLDDPRFVGSAARLVCDPEFPGSQAPHQAQARAETLISAANDSLLAVVSSAGQTRARLVSLQRGFVGSEGARPGCGAEPPEAADSWLQHAVTGPSEPGICFFPNIAGAESIASAVVDSIPDGDVPVDRLSPTTTFETQDLAVLLGVVGDRISGRATDDWSGVALVELAFEPVLGNPIVITPALACTPNRRTCWFDVSPPGQGVFTVRARARDAAGNDEGLNGPRITIVAV